MAAMTKPRLIYVYDALCGWCYGFSPVIRRFCRTYAEAYDFDVLSGGMMTGLRARPIAESMSYIEQAYKVVEQRTGVTFGNDYLTNILRPGTYVSDSEKPGMALTLFKTMRPDGAVDFAGTIQYALYHDGVDLNVDANYGPLVAPFGIDPTEFVARLPDLAVKEQTWSEFNRVAQYGIRGFPAVLLDTGDKLYLVANGYMPYEQLEANVGQAIETDLAG